jgi:hypothetical protein
VLEVTIDGNRDSGRDRDDGDSVGWKVNGRDVKWIVMEWYEVWK